MGYNSAFKGLMGIRRRFPWR